jgi:hypothetical protein
MDGHIFGNHPNLPVDFRDGKSVLLRVVEDKQVFFSLCVDSEEEDILTRFL